MRTLGIDLATANGSTGVCEVDWQTGASSVEVGQFADQALVARMAAVRSEGGWVAIDAPFGFPAAFTAAVTDGRTGPTGFTGDQLNIISREGWIHLPPPDHRLERLARPQ